MIENLCIDYNIRTPKNDDTVYDLTSNALRDNANRQVQDENYSRMRGCTIIMEMTIDYLQINLIELPTYRGRSQTFQENIERLRSDNESLRRDRDHQASDVTIDAGSSISLSNMGMSLRRFRTYLQAQVPMFFPESDYRVLECAPSDN